MFLKNIYLNIFIQDVNQLEPTIPQINSNPIQNITPNVSGRNYLDSFN
jgi:hypothetical protein